MVFRPMKTFSLAGVWNVSTGDGMAYDMKIPGTLDESNLGRREIMDIPSVTRYMRKYKYEGAVRISRLISYHETPGKRCFLEVERGRVLALFIDGEKVEHFNTPTLSAPHVFEVTGRVDGSHILTIVSDNSYPFLPAQAVLSSGAATEESQTNWNGLLGYVRLREETETFVDRIQIQTNGEALSAFVEISSPEAGETILKFSSEALRKDYKVRVSLDQGYTGFRLDGMKLADNVTRWDERSGKLYDLTVAVYGNEKTCSFGVRDIGIGEDGFFRLNGRRIFLRGETDSAVFPETGYAPMDSSVWKRSLDAFANYGVNFVRFRSWCPPEEAFQAADELGMMLMPELPFSDPENLEDPENAESFLKRELLEIIRTYGSHPSFVMCAFGESACTEELASYAHRLDSTRLYAGRDFLLSDTASIGDNRVPVIRTEACDFAMLPEFNEIDLFGGPLLPKNLEEMRARAEKEGLLTFWPRLLSVSGGLSALSYKNTLEEAVQGGKISGILMHALQDFPGRGGEFTGMMNSHLQTKPYDFADPKLFRRFCGEFTLMLRMERSCYVVNDTLEADVLGVNFGKTAVTGLVQLTVTGRTFKKKYSLDPVRFECGQVSAGPHISLDLREFSEDDKDAFRLKLTVSLGRTENEYGIFVYPEEIPICPVDVYEASAFDYQTQKILEEGGTVLLMPSSQEGVLPGAAELKFRTDLSTGTAGAYIETRHPVLKDFPTDNMPDMQWQVMMDGARAVELPKRMKPVVKVLDSAASNRLLSPMFEFRCLKGLVFFTSLRLKENIERPEARHLLNCIYEYLDSYEFSPAETLKPEEVREFVKNA